VYWASLAVLGYLPYVTQPSTIYDAYFLNVNNGQGCQVAVATATFHKCGFIKFQMAVKKILWLCGCKVAVNQIFRNFLIYLVLLNVVVW